MTTSVSSFNSKSEFQQYVDRTIGETKTLLGSYMAQIELVRRKYNSSKKTNPDTTASNVSKGDGGLRKFLGGKKDSAGSKKPAESSISTNMKQQEVKQHEVAGFKVLINPPPEYELRILEDTITSLQERVETFERAKALFPTITNERTGISVVLEDGLPTGFVLHLPESS